VVAATYGDMRIINVYVPNGETVESEKYSYKLKWLPALNRWVKSELKNYSKMALLGDFNIAPEDRDVYDPEIWLGKVLCTLPERDAFNNLLNVGLIDSFRLFEQ
ncbi:exodeoxyribonuclease III, partial [Nitrosococcus oceani C-27]